MSVKEIEAAITELPAKEVAELMSWLAKFQAEAGEPRPFGLCAGEFVVPDDFDAPLPMLV